MTKAARIATNPNPGAGFNRNLIINGNFDIWQRGTSYTYTAGIWVYGHADRWGGHADSSPTGFTYSRSSIVPNAGSKYSMVLTGPSSGGSGSAYLSQRIENTNLTGIKLQDSMTISGYVRTEGYAGRSVGVHLICPTAEDNYASYTTHGPVGDSATITGDATITSTGDMTLTSNNTWYYFTVTYNDPYSTLANFDKGVQLYFPVYNMVDTGDKVYFSQIQVEEGRIPTDFEKRLVGTELSLCERYYTQSFPMGTTPAHGLSLYSYASGSDNQQASSQFWWWQHFRTEMRTTPTIALYNPRSGGTAGRMTNTAVDDSGVTSAVNVGTKHWMIQSGAALPNQDNWYIHWTADAEL